MGRVENIVGKGEIERVCKQHNKAEICYGKGRKTLWEKEKMLVTSIFSFSHNVFKRLLSKGC